MNKLVGLFFLFVFFQEGSQAAVVSEGWKAQAFTVVENRGQITDTEGRLHPEILYTASAGNVRLFFTKSAVYYVYSSSAAQDSSLESPAGSSPRSFYRLDMELTGSGARTELIAEDTLEGTRSYYYAHCPQGIKGVKTFSRLTYRNVYPGVDMVFYRHRDKGVKYDFVVHPGGDTGNIKIRYSETPALENGELVFHTPLGRISETIPLIFQPGSGRSRIVKVTGNYRLSRDTVSFDIPAYDPEKELVVDPWITYYGASADEIAYGICVNGAGEVLVTGSCSNVFPVLNGYQTVSGGNTDAFIAKFSSSGTAIWATFYGGSNIDAGYDIVTDGANNVYVAGTTYSSNFPIPPTTLYPSSLQGTYDAFVVRLDNNGVAEWAGYYGGLGTETAVSIAANAAGELFITGVTNGSNALPVLICNPLNFSSSGKGASDAYLAKFSNAGQLLLSGYLGGTGNEYGRSIEVDVNGDVVITGETFSTNFAGLSGTKKAGSDVFVIKIDATCNVVWGTYLGGTGTDMGKAVTTDAAGNIILTGTTTSTNFVLSSPLTSTPYGTFITKYNPTGTMLWSTYYGAAGGDTKGNDVKTDASGNVIVTGETRTTSFPITPSAVQHIYGGGISDAFLAKLNSTGTATLCATYLGGSGTDIAYSLAVGATGNMYITGSTQSTDLPVTAGTAQTVFGGTTDVFVSEICQSCGPPTIKIAGRPGDVIFSGDTVRICRGDSLTLKAGYYSGSTLQFLNAATGFTWNTSPVVTADSINVKPAVTTQYIVEAGWACGRRDTVTVVVFQPSAPPVTGRDTICVGSPDTLIAVPGFVPIGVEWYRDTTGAMLSSNDTLFTGPLSATDSFYVRLDSSGCKSPFTKFKVNVKVCLTVPVELLSFRGRMEGGQALLSWETATESGSDYFSVQKSTDALDFISLGKVKAAGNSAVMRSYSFTDPAPGPGMCYYRLVQADYDGAVTVSPVIALNAREGGSQAVINPHPVRDDLHLTLFSGEEKRAVVQLYDATGRLLLAEPLQLSRGDNRLSIPLEKSTFPPGFYVLSIHSPEALPLKLKFIVD
jgi:hypothetical protein